MVGYEFYRGSTPDFMIWEAYGVWGHVYSHDSGIRFTLYDPALGRHRRIPPPADWEQSRERWRVWD